MTITALQIREARKKFKITQEELAKRLGVSRQTVVGYEKGDIIPESKSLILQSFINSEQLLSNNESKISSDLIAYYEDIDVTGGNEDMFSDGSLQPTGYMQIPHFEDCDKAFPLWGDSMWPVYQSGQIVLCKEFLAWRDYVPYGEVFLIITDSLRTVKYVKKASSEDKYLLVSENPHFDPFEVSKEHIRKMYIVKGAIKRNLI